MKFLHTSDWQIGMKGSGLGEAGPIVREARIESAQGVLSMAKAEGADFLLLCGDIFEHNMVSQEEVKKIIRAFNEYDEIPIFLLPGNHDALGPGCVYNRDIFRNIAHLHILDSAEPVTVGDAVLHPCPVFARTTRHDSTEGIPDVHEFDGVHIGVAHGSLVGRFPVAEWEGVDLPINPSCVERTGIDYLALGHWHSQRIFEDRTGILRLAYCGTHEQTEYSEDDAGCCLLVTIDEKGATPTLRPLESGHLKWRSVEFAMKDASSLQELRELLNALRGVDMVRLSLNGELPLSSKDEFDKLLQSEELKKHRNLRVESRSMRIVEPFSEDTAVDTGDPTLNLTDARLRQQLADEVDPTKRMIIAEAITRLQVFAKEAEE